MTYTTNYNLKKPELNDYAGPDAFNDNAEIIDTQMKANAAAADINGKTEEVMLTDGDAFPFYDASATESRKTLWSNIKSVLKAYFDTLYAAASGVFSKTESLSDSTKSIYYLDNSAVPDDVFQTIASNMPTRDDLNRSLFAPVITAYGATDFDDTDIVFSGSDANEWVLKATIPFLMTGIGGYSRKLKFTMAFTSQGNSNIPRQRLEVVMPNAVTYTSVDFTVYSTQVIIFDIVQPTQGMLSFDLKVYGTRNSSSTYSGGITITSITAAADVVAYL